MLNLLTVFAEMEIESGWSDWLVCRFYEEIEPKLERVFEKKCVKFFGLENSSVCELMPGSNEKSPHGTMDK